MSERLQELERSTGEVSTVNVPVEYLIDEEYAKSVVESVKNAKSEILVCAYAWRWYENQPEIDIQKLNIAVMQASFRGIRVRCIVDNFTIYNMLKKNGIPARYTPQNKMLHTKAICIDSEVVIVGSHNLTKRATTTNYEISVKLTDFEAVAQFKVYFEKIWEYGCESK